MRILLYQKIADLLSKQIKNGVIQPGKKMPSLRTICLDFKVSLTTSVEAYHELEKRGLIESRPQSGFYVRYRSSNFLLPIARKSINIKEPTIDEKRIANLYKDLNNEKITKFSLGVPENELLPISRLNKEMIAATRSLLGSGLAYDDIQGNVKLRRNAARITQAWGGEFCQEDLVTTSGAMNGLSFALMSITKPGDTIAVESPVYFGLLQLAKSLNLKIIEVSTHPNFGIDISVIRRKIKLIKAVILISNFNNPIGSCMPDANKRELVELLSQYEVPLIEDDLYGDIYFGQHRPKPCKAFDENGLVIWINSVSKTLAPGYRVGWMLPGVFKDQIIHQKLIHSLSSNSLSQEAIGNFLEKGQMERHLQQLRMELFGNSLNFMDTITLSFPENIKISQPKGGFFLWVEFEKGFSVSELYERCIRQNISIAPGSMFSLTNQYENCMRLSFGQKWSNSVAGKLKQVGKIAKSLQ